MCPNSSIGKESSSFAESRTATVRFEETFKFTLGLVCVSQQPALSRIGLVLWAFDGVSQALAWQINRNQGEQHTRVKSDLATADPARD